MAKKKNDTNRQDEIKKTFSISVQGIEKVWALNRETGKQMLSTFAECI